MSTLIENVDKVVAARAALKTAIAAKGVAVPDGAKLSDMAGLVEGIKVDTAQAVQKVSFYKALSGSAILSPVIKFDFTAATDVSYCFSSCSSLTSLTLPDGFGSAATDVVGCFGSCSSLTSLTLPDGFGSAATDVVGCFDSCSSLTSLTLPDGFGSAATDVSYCFSSCSSLTSLTLPDGFGSAATSVSECFRSCSSLQNVTGAIKFKVSFDMHWSTQLTHESLVNIINGLVTVTSAKTLTLGSTNLAKLTDAEKAIATAKGWTLA